MANRRGASDPPPKKPFLAYRVETGFAVSSGFQPAAALETRTDRARFPVSTARASRTTEPPMVRASARRVVFFTPGPTTATISRLCLFFCFRRSAAATSATRASLAASERKSTSRVVDRSVDESTQRITASATSSTSSSRSASSSRRSAKSNRSFSSPVVASANARSASKLRKPQTGSSQSKTAPFATNDFDAHGPGVTTPTAASRWSNRRRF